MKHSGKARKAALRIILWSLLAVAIIWALGVFAAAIIALAGALAVAITPIVIVVWIIFALFTLYFFRDPTAHVPPGTNLVLSPAHGKVDVIDTTIEPQFMGGECQRISMFLSVVDVHVQNAPVSGKIAFFKYATGQFLNALRTESAEHNENVLLGFELSDLPGRKLAVRLIAGAIARRIVPWVQQGDVVVRGERISLIQFGSRAEVYLPLNARIKVKLGDRAVGGETVFAELE
jgi:phosphatidylserine decarboxylase